MMVLLAVVGLLLLGALALSRLLLLAPTQLGWLMYLPNVFFELYEKRTGRSRWRLEAVLVLVACALVGVGFNSVGAGFTALAVYLLLVVENMLRERRIVRAVYGAQESVGLRRASTTTPGYPSPGLHPRLSVNLEGPFVERVPHYDLGTVLPDAPIEIAVLVGNHTRVPCQTPVSVAIQVPAGWALEGGAARELPPLRSGQVERVRWVLTPSTVAKPAAPATATTTRRGGSIRIRVQSSRFDQSLEVRNRSVRAVTNADIATAAIRRYPGARRAAYSWRGDMDLYDTATFQTIQGLEDALGLGTRYCVAQTMFLSTRLSMDERAATQWAEHYGVSRGAEVIPAFIAWMREMVDLRHDAPYPAVPSKRYVMELGNHGHLHYSTDTAGDPGNDWKTGARPGDGRYPWQGDDHTSFGDQRDNTLQAARLFETHFGFVPRSWAKPGRGNDRYSAAAMEAAGCEVVTGSDIRPRDNVLRQPPPHHPHGTKVVELTARYPTDPQHVHHLAMIEFWMARGHRLGQPVIILVHQHMRQFDGAICATFTEHILDRAVNGFHGDLYIDTVYGVGRYWLDVLSQETGRVSVHVDTRDGNGGRSGGGGGVRVTNGTNRTIPNVPLDITLRSGERLTRLLDLPPGETKVDLR